MSQWGRDATWRLIQDYESHGLLSPAERAELMTLVRKGREQVALDLLKGLAKPRT